MLLKKMFGALLLLSIIPHALAQNKAVSANQEYHKLIRATEAIGTMGADLFGDQQNFATGTVSFTQTDVALPGNNGLAVAVGRRFSMEDWGSERGSAQFLMGQFGDWELDVPYMHGVFSSSGWLAQNFTVNGGTENRCTQFDEPPERRVDSLTHFLAREYWHGNSMYVPGAGDQEVLRRAAGNALAPGGATATYPLVTATHWQISCLASLKRGSGEGFQALSPDGTRYWFDWMVSLPRTKSSKGVGSAPRTPGDGHLERDEVRLYATRVEDRFGNWVTYTYDAVNPNRLTEIKSGDGRVISLFYNDAGRVYRVNDGSRVWEYFYTGNYLTSITLPDNSRWIFSMASLFEASLDAQGGTCALPGNAEGATVTGSMTHPSGAVGTFTVSPQRFGRTFAPWTCQGDASVGYTSQPIFFDTLALQRKQITGPGTSLTWNFSYGTSPVGCWDPATAGNTNTPPGPSTVCPANLDAPRVVTVTGPDDVVEYTFGSRHNVNEGRLLKKREGKAGVWLKTETMEYTTPVGPNPVGDSIRKSGDTYFAERNMPQKSTLSTVNGKSFNWNASTWDQYGNPTTVARSSAAASGTLTKTETITYAHNTSLWVLGLRDKTTDSASGLIEEDIDYDTLGNPTAFKRFGRLDETRGYCVTVTSACPAKGLLSSVADGAGKTTTLSNHYRGIPRLVTFPDTRTISGVVNAQGWVTSYTDELGATTTYDYDSMGRLKTLTHPSDSTIWAPTTITFAKVTGTDFGTSASYWKQNIATGDYRKEIVFDALWRPAITREWDQVTGESRATVRQFDAEGRETFVSFPDIAAPTVNSLSLGTRNQYDALGRLIQSDVDSELGNLRTRIDYLTNYRKQITNPRSQVTTVDFMQYDQAGEELPTKISAPGATVDITRDRWGKPTAVTRSGTVPAVSATRNYVYDANQRLCKLVEPEKGADIYAYDSANRIDWMARATTLTALTGCSAGTVTAAQKTTFGYDQRDRQTSVNPPSGTLRERRTYTATGLLETHTRGDTTNGNIFWSYTYNKRGLITGASVDVDTHITGGTASNFKWQYTQHGHLNRETFVNGLVIEYAPNALGQAKKVWAPFDNQSFATNVSYYPNGALKQFTYGNGVVHTLTQNTRKLPWVSADKFGSTNIVHYTMTYDQNGNPTQVVDATGHDSKTMGYDALDRLTSASGSFGSATMSYDGLDNLIQYKVGSRDQRYVMGSGQRLSRINNAAGTKQFGFSYDALGNVTQKEDVVANRTLNFSFDQAYRLLDESQTVGTTTTQIQKHRYDAQGFRNVTIKANGDPRQQTYGLDGALSWDFDAQVPNNVAVSTTYIRLAGSLIAKSTTRQPLSVTASSVQGAAECRGNPNGNALFNRRVGTTDDTLGEYCLPYNPFRRTHFDGENPIEPLMIDGVPDEDATQRAQASATAAAVTGSTTFVHTDALGSPVLETDRFGNPVANTRTQYEPYGLPTSPPLFTVPSYTGHQFDPNTKLVYAQQRYYDPQIGRFLSVDPMAVDTKSAGNWNRYAYGANSPYKFTDPDGRQAQSHLCDIGGCDAGSFSKDEGSSGGQAEAQQRLNAFALERLEEASAESMKNEHGPGGAEAQGWIYLFAGELHATPMTTQRCSGGDADCEIDSRITLRLVPRGAVVLADFHSHGRGKEIRRFNRFSDGDIERANLLPRELYKIGFGTSFVGSYVAGPDGNAYFYRSGAIQTTPINGWDVWKVQQHIGYVTGER